MKRLISFCIFSLGLLAAASATDKRPADYVNPFIGTTNFGTTNPGAVCPNGMMSVVPFNAALQSSFSRMLLRGLVYESSR